MLNFGNRSFYVHNYYKEKQNDFIKLRITASNGIQLEFIFVSQNKPGPPMNKKTTILVLSFTIQL